MAVAEAAIPEGLAEATRHQPRARAALAAALATGPSHAYLFRGPPGSGKRAAARAFSAELLADAAPDPDDARRRAMIEPSPHPDLVWIAPPGAQHLVDEVRESVIRAASLRPAEGEHRAFVIEEAEGLRDESQNALLKTLEEPAEFAHLILICSEPELLAGTILSRCQTVEFAPLGPDAVLESLGESGPEAEAIARLSGGDLALARFLLTDGGRSLRAAAESAARAALVEPPPKEPWAAMLTAAEDAGAEAGAEEERRLVEDAAGGGRSRSGKLTKDATDQVKRTGRRARTRALDLGLGLVCSWYRDLSAVASGADDVLFNTDRRGELSADAEGLDGAAAREAVELVLDTRRRLRVNVSEELALEALWLRLAERLC